jgi:hypothetical protein
MIDGILEWRFIWTSHDPGEASTPQYQPALSHKVACLGRSQARLLESWGNFGKCEVVGLPRLDTLLESQPRRRQPGAPTRLLITTARTPGFARDQVRTVERSLQDLKTWLDRARSMGRFDIEPVWRLTFELEGRLGVRNELSDDTGQELARMLADVDAMVTTPSTCLVEGMLQGIPVALLDYHNCPQYVPAAWSITAREHLDQVLPELVAPPTTHMLHQKMILHDTLECRTPALPRLIRLVEDMVHTARECRQAGRPLVFPGRILPDGQGGHHLWGEGLDAATLQTDQAVFDARDRTVLQKQIGHLRAQHRRDTREIEVLRHRLARVDPSVWLRAVARTVLPQGLRRLVSGRGRGPMSRQRPSWAAEDGVATRPRSAGGEGKGSDV